MNAQSQPTKINAELDGEGLSIGTATGEVITLRAALLSLEGDHYLVPQSHDLCAYLSDGTLLVAKGKLKDTAVQSYIYKIKAKRGSAPNCIEVEISDLRKVYAHARNSANGRAIRVENDETDVKMRRELVELISRAAAFGASDIHISADDQAANVQMRVNGIMMHWKQIPEDYAKQMMQAAYAMGTASDTNYNPYSFQNASIVDADGKLGLPRAVQSIRLQWNPLMLSGRYLVMRLHYTSAHAKMDLDGLGFSRAQLEQIRLMRQKSTGIVIISGPTGSGKSTTLKNALANLYRERNQEINIITVEDPPEYYIAGVKQMQVMNAATQEDRKAKFLQAIMAALRDDPDAMMIGEIRDKESASLAYEAANTGHSVWTSLHANNAVSIVNRLLDLGLEPYKVTDHETIIGLIGQRLVRRLCPKCRIRMEQALKSGSVSELTAERATRLLERLSLGNAPLFARNPDGCVHCRKKGLVGRTVAAEVITPDEKFMNFCREHRKSEARAYWIREHKGISIMAHAVAKMIAGQVSPDDVERSVDPIAFDESMVHVPALLAELRNG